ncbi:MAG: proprotein convertase P-domain-containing protein [Pseudomonadota bacterium]
MTFVRTMLAVAGLVGFATAANAEIFLAGPGLGLDLPDDDANGVTSSIDASGVGTVESVSIAVSIDHTWVGDLIWTVTSPSGTTVTLMDRPGNPEQGDFGDSSDMSSGLALIFDDRFIAEAESAGSDCDSSPSDTMGDGCVRAFIPESALSGFNGESGDGTWTLFLSDNAGGDLGVLNGWALVINNRGMAPQQVFKD